MKAGILNLSLIFFLAAVFLAVDVFNFGRSDSVFKTWDQQKVVLQGTIVSDPERYKVYQRRFEVQPYGTNQKVLVSTFNRNSFFYGDKVYVIGKLKLPINFGDYDYAGYLMAKDIYAAISGADVFITGKARVNIFAYHSLRLKHWIYEKFENKLPADHAALLIALVVGQKDLMSPELVDAFSKAGVAHLIAVSGYILTLILIFAERLRPVIGKLNAIILCMVIAAAYIVISGFAAGVLRAALMAGIYLLAKFNNRQYNPLSSLLLAASIIVAMNPLVIANDIGFALSFSSLLGIILFSPFLQLPAKRKIFKYAAAVIVATLSAQIATVPITAYYFKEFSIIAPLSNLLVIPLITPILAVAYFLCLPLISVVAAPLLKVPLGFIIFLVNHLSGVPHASLRVGVGKSALILIYIAELAAYAVLLKRRKRSVKITK